MHGQNWKLTQFNDDDDEDAVVEDDADDDEKACIVIERAELKSTTVCEG